MLGEIVKFTPSIVSEDSPIRIRAGFSATWKHHQLNLLHTTFLKEWISVVWIKITFTVNSKLQLPWLLVVVHCFLYYICHFNSQGLKCYFLEMFYNLEINWVDKTTTGHTKKTRKVTILHLQFFWRYQR